MKDRGADHRRSRRHSERQQVRRRRVRRAAVRVPARPRALPRDAVRRRARPHAERPRPQVALEARRNSESSTIAAGGLFLRACRARSARSSSASPVAVPPSACSACSVDLTCARSCVGRSTVCGPSAKATRPTCSCFGHRSRKRVAAALAAARRVGETSVAFIEPEVSVTSITDAFSTGTATVASGRASAIGHAGQREHSSAGGRCARTRLLLRHDRGQRRRRGEADDVLRRPPAGERTARAARAGRRARPARNSGA